MREDRPGWARRAAAAWVLIALAETLHGIARSLWLMPLMGDLRARQWAIVSGLLIIVVIALATVRWIGARRLRTQLKVGLMWALLMLGFDVFMGHWIIGFPWPRIAQDFNPQQGGFLGLGMLAMIGAPWLAARLRRVS